MPFPEREAFERNEKKVTAAAGRIDQPQAIKSELEEGGRESPVEDKIDDEIRSL